MNQQQLFLQGLKELGGRATVDQVNAHLGKDLHRAVAPLLRAGKIEKSEERHPTQTGKTAIVLQFADPNYRPAQPLDSLFQEQK